LGQSNNLRSAQLVQTRSEAKQRKPIPKSIIALRCHVQEALFALAYPFARLKLGHVQEGLSAFS